MKQKLYLSNPGIATAAGCDTQAFWNALVDGDNSGLVKVKTFSGETFFAGRIDGERLSPTNAKYDMRIIQIEDLALRQIAPFVERAKEKYGASRIAVCVGSCDNGTEFSLAGHREFFATKKFPENYSLEMQSADYPATFAKEKFGLHGPAFVFATACSSSASAIAKGAELIRAGIVDAAIVGGADVASDTALLGFNSLKSISTEKTNPFSKNRAGITLGEGAAFFVLAKDFCVVQNSSDNYDENCENCIELLGVGESCDAHHMTSPLADGSGALCAMSAALEDASLGCNDIDYINLHGTGTKLNDAMESLAVSQCFGESICEINCNENSQKKIFASSTKPITGHVLGASSAIELAACFLAIKNNSEKNLEEIKLPLHVFDGERDENLPRINLVGRETKFSKPIDVCMSNSFGFGGCNVSLIIGKSRSDCVRRGEEN